MRPRIYTYLSMELRVSGVVSEAQATGCMRNTLHQQRNSIRQGGFLFS
jgi:hypothetical protein